MRILVVEDDDVLRDGLVAGLGLEGFEVDAVATCEDARSGIATGDQAGVVLGEGRGHSGMSALIDVVARRPG